MSFTYIDPFKLLIVDDDEDILSLLKESLSSEGYDIYLASTLQEARELLARQEVHIILSDQHLPDGSGIDFLAELPGTGTDIIPILMTGYPDLNLALEAINRGKVYKFVKKPVDLDLLKQIVRRAAEYHARLSEKKYLASEVLRHNQLLRQQSELQWSDLKSAQNKIRKHSLTVSQQKKQIETLYAEIQSAYLHTVTSLCAAIEAKDTYTRGHGERVFFYCALIAHRLGLKDSSFEALKHASILHDIGKIGVPDSILLKNAPLTESEMAVIRTHLQIAEDILIPLPFLEKTRRIILHHHERWDGKGYPEGLKGDEISLEGRILAVADAYDAMRSRRAYRNSLSKQAAIEQLEAGVGKQFCPLCVSVMRIGLEQEGESPEVLMTPLSESLIQPIVPFETSVVARKEM